MFKVLNLKSVYNSYDDDLGSDFYNPVLENSIKYDRVSAYFSAGAIANFSKGLEALAKKHHCCRFIISSEISKEDFEQIKQGYELREGLQDEMLARLREEISLEEERNISNLAYLISIKVVEIKVAFTHTGIFHDKFGIMEDKENSIICFRGSNNETQAAFKSNYESFDITCSWQCSSFDRTKIERSKEVFEKLWSNLDDRIHVCEMDHVLYEEIEKHNKGRCILDKVFLEKDSLVLDYENNLKLIIGIDESIIWNNSVYKMRLKKYVCRNDSKEKMMIFKNGLTYIDFKKIIEILTKDAKKRNYKFLISNRLIRFIESREMHILKRANLGLNIKNKNDNLLDKFTEFSNVVNVEMKRKLREQQMWDAFFMCTMKKSGNFSVPGAGKTASVLGAFSYLRKKKFVKRIVVISPKNAFESWENEFELCFDGKIKLNSFNIHDDSYSSSFKKKQALRLDVGSKNLFLFNYESVGAYMEEIKMLITKDTILVFDEIHKVKAINGLRASNSLEIAKKSHYTIILTGTPIPNSYCDIINPLRILYNDEYRDFFSFNETQLKKPSINEIADINEKIQPFFCRTTKRQLMVPEPKPDQVIDSFSSEEENRIYHLLSIKYAKNKFALIIRLMQLQSNPKLLLEKLDLSEFAEMLDISVEDIDYVDYSNELLQLIESVDKSEKFKECIKLLKKLNFENKPVILWCIFVGTMFNIESELKKLGIKCSIIYGGISMAERIGILNDFRSGGIDILITNPHTLAESVSLHSICHDSVYFEYSYNLVHLLQSKDRIHRLGLASDQYTQYYYLRNNFMNSDGKEMSLDKSILNRLSEKEEIMIEAIENNRLEVPLTNAEDLAIIFDELGF
ncbi:MAG: SNF2-related protein [Bacilli bacterium]